MAQQEHHQAGRLLTLALILVAMVGALYLALGHRQSEIVAPALEPTPPPMNRLSRQDCSERPRWLVCEELTTNGSGCRRYKIDYGRVCIEQEVQ